MFMFHTQHEIISPYRSCKFWLCKVTCYQMLNIACVNSYSDSRGLAHYSLLTGLTKI